MKSTSKKYYIDENGLVVTGNGKLSLEKYKEKSKYRTDYIKNNYRVFAFRVKRQDQELISFIESLPSVNALVNKLIKQAMKEGIREWKK